MSVLRVTAARGRCRVALVALLASASVPAATLGCGGGGASQSVHTRLSDDIDFEEEGDARHPASERVRAGEAKLVAGDLEGALQDFRAALAEDPDDARAHLNVGLVLELGGALDGAEAAYRRALAIDADFPEALNNLGLLLIDSERVAEAVSLLRHAVELRPGYAEATLNLGLALEEQGDLDGAIEAYRRAARLAPNDAYPRVSLGLLLAERGDAAGARTELQRARSLAQGDAATLLQIGAGLRQLSDFEGAVQALRSALEANDGELTPALGGELALAQLGAGDPDGARATLDQAIARTPSDAALYQLLAGVALQRRDIPAARAALRRMLEVEPRGARADSARAWLEANP